MILSAQVVCTTCRIHWLIHRKFPVGWRACKCLEIFSSEYGATLKHCYAFKHYQWSFAWAKAGNGGKKTVLGGGGIYYIYIHFSTNWFRENIVDMKLNRFYDKKEDLTGVPHFYETIWNTPVNIVLMTFVLVICCLLDWTLCLFLGQTLDKSDMTSTTSRSFLFWPLVSDDSQCTLEQNKTHFTYLAIKGAPFFTKWVCKDDWVMDPLTLKVLFVLYFYCSLFSIGLFSWDKLSALLFEAF